MGNGGSAVFDLIGTLALLLLTLIARRWLARLYRWVHPKRQALLTDCCPCGYPLAGLEHARCPECGRVIGFDSTPEQLGLTDDELQRIMARRDARMSNRK